VQRIRQLDRGGANRRGDVVPGAFYEAIGAVKNAQFFDDTACMVFSDTMLMTHDKYRQFTIKNIADARINMIADRDADAGGGLRLSQADLP